MSHKTKTKPTIVILPPLEAGDIPQPRPKRQASQTASGKMMPAPSPRPGLEPPMGPNRRGTKRHRFLYFVF